MGRKRKKSGLTDNVFEVRRENNNIPAVLAGESSIGNQMLPEVIAHLRHILFDYCKDQANSSLHTSLEKAMNEISEL